MTKIVSKRSNALFGLGTAAIGWSKLAAPDEKYGKFSLDYPTEALTSSRVLPKVDAEIKRVVAEVREELEAEYAKDKKLELEITTVVDSIESWLEDAERTADEDYRVDNIDTYVRLQLENKKGVAKKTGKPYDIRPKVYQRGSNKPMAKEDVPNLAPGSKVRPIIQVGAYSPAPQRKSDPRVILVSVKLAGVGLVDIREMGGNKAPSDLWADMDDDDDVVGNATTGSDPDFDNDDF